MSSVYVGRPRANEPHTYKPKAPNQFCKRVSYRDGDAYECNEPTSGKTYCPSCARHLLTLTDRAPLPQQPAPKPYHWTQDQILPRKRA